MHRTKSKPSGLGGLATFALAVGVCTLTLASSIYFAHEADLAAAQREQQVVENGIDNLVRELSRKAVPQAVWDDAVRNLDIRFDPTWAATSIGAYFGQTEHFDSAFVVGHDGEVLYAMRDGGTVAASRIRDLLSNAQSIVGAVRLAESRRGPLAGLVARGETLAHPIMAAQVREVSGVPYVLSATLVQPDFGTAMPQTACAPIIITAKAIDQRLVARLADELLLTDARLYRSVAAVANAHAVAQIADGDGRLIATLEWRPPRPGSVMLMRALPPMALVLFLLGGLSIWLYRRNRRAAENLIASEARASHLAYHDVLTGLANRLLLANRLERALEGLRRDGVSFAIHCIDLDRFKEINDTFGHGAGDELIREVAHVLVQACRPTDVIARLGGDEFAVVQLGATQASAEALAARIVSLMSEPVNIVVGRVFVGCSIGVALIQDGGGSASECLREADLALYRAKDNGRGRYALFEAGMDQALRVRLQVREELREALAANQLKLVYQPQVHDGKIYGVEALVRWRHPTRGEISPAVFVPIAEETGLIDALGAFTLRRAFEDSKRLGDLRVAVNISAAQLRLREFPDQLRTIVRETGADAQRIDLEITEGLLLGDDPLIQATLKRIRSMGFRIALDDFGTGYSSLSYLQRYPIDKIKIDRSFIANLGVEPQADAVIAAIVRLARALRLEVIAEGVETEMQRLRLAAAGCGDIQGFLFGRPMPLAKLEAHLRAAAGSASEDLAGDAVRAAAAGA
ncbi:MAG: EAL domain-containing protein [Proteobacteria bacterium]|nr:EAL domain-containing protein [Pseudomonadota bacterium]